MILALFPDTGSPVDLAASGAASWASYFARSLDCRTHPTVLVRANDGEPHRCTSPRWTPTPPT